MRTSLHDSKSVVPTGGGRTNEVHLIHTGSMVLNSALRVGIITSSFNQGEYIRDTLEKVWRQSSPLVQHLVMDGGSTDETLDVLDEYKEAHLS